MKIKEIAIVGSKISDTTSSGTTSSGQPAGQPQDIVPDMVNGKILCQPDHSAISEGVSQIFRRKKGGYRRMERFKESNRNLPYVR